MNHENINPLIHSLPLKAIIGLIEYTNEFNERVENHLKTEVLKLLLRGIKWYLQKIYQCYYEQVDIIAMPISRILKTGLPAGQIPLAGDHVQQEHQ